MNKCLLSRPGLIAGPLHSTPLQIISQSIPRLDPIDSKSSYCLLAYKLIGTFVCSSDECEAGPQRLTTQEQT